MDESSLQTLRPDDLQALAGLIGSTTSQLKEIDKRVVGGSANVRALKVNPEAVLKQAIVSSGQVSHPVQNRPASPPPAPPQYDSGMSHPSSSYVAPVGSVGTIVQPMQVVMLDSATLEKFQSELTDMRHDISLLRNDIASLCKAQELLAAALERTLNKGLKTLTIRFNDSVDQKQESVS